MKESTLIYEEHGDILGPPMDSSAPPERKSNRIDRISGILLTMFAGMFLFMLAIYSIDTSTNPAAFMQNFIADDLYRTTAIAGMSDNITITIADFCNPMPADQQAACVINQLGVYNYTMNKGVVESPQEFYEKGGVCRDIAVFYASIFKRMGWTVYYDFHIKQHVFIEVTRTFEKDGTGKQIRCTLDGLDYNCVKY